MYHQYVSSVCIISMYHQYVSSVCISMYHQYVSSVCIISMYQSLAVDHESQGIVQGTSDHGVGGGGCLIMEGEDVMRAPQAHGVWHEMKGGGNILLVVIVNAVCYPVSVPLWLWYNCNENDFEIYI